MIKEVNIQKVMLSLFIYYQNNFHMLHWKSKGKGFDTAHKQITSDYYETLADDIDDIAEVLLRNDINPPSYKEVLEILEESDIEVITIDNEKNYDIEDIIKLSQKMLEDLFKVLIEVHEIPEMKEVKNIGVLSFYENLIDKYDKECRYLNKRRF